MPLPRVKPSKIKKPRRPKAIQWVELEQRIEELPGVWCIGEVLNLPGWKTIKYKETDHDILVLAELTTECVNPCDCGTPSSEFQRWGFTAPCYVRDIPIRFKRVRVYFRPQRNCCKKCGRTFQQPLIAIDERHSMMRRLVEYIEKEAFKIFKNFSALAEEVGCNEQTVRNIFTRRSNSLEVETKKLKKEGSIKTPEWLAIDEVYPMKEAEFCVITAPAHQQVLNVLPVNKEKELFRWLLQLPDRRSVKVVTIDMWPEYRRTVRRLLPQALIVVDRYHVHNLLNVALKQVLEVIRHSLSYTENRAYMRPEHLLLTSYRCLSEERQIDDKGKERLSPREVADKWLKDVPDIARAHRLKEEFFDILQLKDRQKAEELTDGWLKKVIDFTEYFRAQYKKNYFEKWPDPFGNIPNTISQWRANILHYIDCGLINGATPTNSFAEFTNGQIKKAYRIGNHYSYEVLRLKVIYGGVIISRRPPHPLVEKKTRISRKNILTPGKKKLRAKNPEANLEILKTVREEQDETRGLLPKPQENPDWSTRFEIDRKSEQNRAFKNERESKKTGRRPIRFDPNQLKIF